ncbi:MAG TPA: hypothetical protein VFC09_04580 [Candidatus Dormibacteraeota bacterium]|nr:hypothetical protein [Candidatus Dormibacteraeota bacterium]
MAVVEAPARLVLAAAVWQGQRLVEPGPTLDAALRLARRNQVQGALARVYPEALGAELEHVVQGNADFRHRLGEAVTRLQAAGVDPVLIKCDPAADFVYGNFDLVVGADGWARSLEALGGWAARYSGHRLEPDKLIVHPASGPAAHLHRDASWFGVVAITAEVLRRGAVRDPEVGVLRPDPVDELRLRVAHAVFQNLAYDLAELLAIRDVLRLGASPEEARRRSAAEGWGGAFDSALAVARRSMDTLDRGDALDLPVGLPPARSLLDGAGHAVHLAREGRNAMALREVALRAPLVAAKLRRRVKRPRVGLVGVSGPDGSGKTSLVAALREEAEVEHTRVVSLHPYGCVVCRRWPGTNGHSSGESPSSAGRLRRRALRLHAMVDVAELELRVAAARTWMRVRGIGDGAHPALVITDRSPLDALAKHVDAGPRVRRWLVGLARRYDRILLLDADGAVLAERDQEHSHGELARQRRRFLDLATAVDATRVDSSGPFSTDLVGHVVRDVTSAR